MKKLIIVALVAIAVLVFCAPAMAWPVAHALVGAVAPLHLRRQDPGRGHDREHASPCASISPRAARRTTSATT